MAEGALYLPYISPISPLYLPYISLISRQARKSIVAEGGVLPRRKSVTAAAAAGGEGGSKKGPDKEEFFDVTIVRDMVRGFLPPMLPSYQPYVT